MNEFLKLAYELLSLIFYNIVACLSGFFGGLAKLFVTGWPEYIAVFNAYFGELPFFAKILAILLAVILIAIPIGIIILIVRKIVLHVRLKNAGDDNVSLFKEIGRLNRQVLQLMDEKEKILSLKVSNGMGGLDKSAIAASAVSRTGDDTGDLTDEQILGVADASRIVAEGTDGIAMAGVPVGNVNTLPGEGGAVAGVPVAGVAGEGAGVAGIPVAGGVAVGGDIGENAVVAAAEAAATAAAKAKAETEALEQAQANRFPKLSLVDLKYADYQRPDFNGEVTLQQFTEGYRLFAASQMHLYYTPEIVRRFVAGMASSKILILEGISGTGKTSLPYSFSRYLGNPATMISVQPSYRDRTELLGYFNEFSKRFNETEFLRALYEAGYREDPTLIVLDEMNLARIEYYFAEMLSVLELPSQDEWTLDLVPTAWPGDPKLLSGGKIWVSPHTWFVGTANNDDSTFTITDKVYDRAMPIELNERADAFECEDVFPCPVTCEHLNSLFATAKEEHPISESTMTRMAKINSYLQTRFKLSFGNRIMKQMYDFIPVYVACGGTELDGLDYILARKVLKKFETQNVTFVRDEIKGLLAYMEKTFGKTQMQDSVSYLQRIQNLY